ncbi:MAG: dihydropteroate synthase [Acidiphilium sp.]|nr:dihydropteroate synthase [Acidiphilium sp.]MDD4934776.1 dihydropteroate synthase [Acidiphilium sp.]
MLARIINHPRRWAGLELTTPLVMGIVNVTPDSFSGDGTLADVNVAIAQGRAMLAAGADIIDIGGESTRPGAHPVAPTEEIRRVVPVVQALTAAGAVVSVDTRNAATMAAALDAGARIINDVSALRHDPEAAGVIAARGCPIVLMHMRGTPATMGSMTHYADLTSEILDELAARREAACAAGIAPDCIALDPGFGFAKTGEQNVALLRSLERFCALGHPVLIGVSRKRFIGELANEANPRQRDAGSIAATLFAVRHGAAIVRVHDVASMVQALRVWRALEPG